MDKLSIIAFLLVVGGLAAPLLLLARWRTSNPLIFRILTVLVLFASGELLILWRHILMGTLLFIAGTVIFVFMSLSSLRRQQIQTESSYRHHSLVAIALLIAVLAVGGSLRFWNLGQAPYGIEQDEMTWTVGAAHASYPDRSYEATVPTYREQREHLPMSSFQEHLFFDHFGVSIETARLENATLSTAAIAVFYLLALQLTSPPGALIATFFLAISTLHIASARQAHVESHVLFWVFGSYCLFWMAVRHRSVLLFLATGISAVIGLWTYETYNTTIAVIVGSFVITALRDLRHWRFHAVSLAVFLVPIGLVAQDAFRHAQARHAYQFQTFDAFRGTVDGPLWKQGWEWLTYFSDNLRSLFEDLFVKQTRPAYEFPMVRPSGPMVLAVVIPLALLGLLLVLRAPRRQEHGFLLVWLPVQLLAVPAILGAGWGRVLLPATPALFVLAGVGGAFLMQQLRFAFGRQAWAPIMAIFVLGITLVGLGARAYFSEVQDPEDRRIRREVVDAVAAERDTEAFILLPVPQGQVLPRERLLRPSPSGMRFLLGKPRDLKSAEHRYRYVRLGDLLEGVRAAPVSRPVMILMPHRNQDPRIPVPPEEVGVRRCYDVEAAFIGEYVDMLEITSEARATSHC